MWVIGIQHRYGGVSYFNKENDCVGAKHFATKYSSEEEADIDTCALLQFFQESEWHKPALYQKVVVEEISL